MKKKSIAARLGIAAMALTLITTSLSSGTLAKYTTTYNATTTLTIAKWNPGVSISKDADGNQKWLYWSGTPVTTAALSETAYGVKSGAVKTGEIAPGMAGEFTIDVSSAGEDHKTVSGVAMDCQIYINKTGTTPANFTMKIKDQGDALKFNDADKADPTLGWKLGEPISLKANSNDAKKVTVEWEWPYGTGDSANDAKDTANGKAGGTGTYAIAIVFTQQNPNDVSSST